LSAFHVPSLDGVVSPVTDIAEERPPVQGSGGRRVLETLHVKQIRREESIGSCKVTLKEWRLTS